MYRKMIVYDRKDKLFHCYINGEKVGETSTSPAAESLLNKLVYELLTKKAEVKG